MGALNLQPPYSPLEASRFRTKSGYEIILADVHGPGPDAVCADDHQLRWACGLRGRAALINALGDETVTCDVAQRLEGKRRLARCRIGKGDLARLLTAQGWVRPEAQAEADYAQELKQAQSRKAGLWNGGWTVVIEGPPAREPPSLR